MSSLKINKKETLSTSAVTKIIQNPYHQQEMITICFDGVLETWELPYLKNHKGIPLGLNKLTSIVPFQNHKGRGFLLGAGNGELAMIDENFKKMSTNKLHRESISDIIVSNDRVITIGYDGQMMFLNKENLDVYFRHQFEYPLFSAVEYDNRIYVASLKSFIVNKITHQYEETKRFNKFFIFNSRIYGTSDDRGLTCLNTNSNNYIPAEFLLMFQRKIMIFSEKSICVSSQLEKLEYKAKKYAEFSQGESITTGFACDGNLYVGGNQGNIYWISEEK